MEKEIGERREHIKEERLRRRQMRKKEELKFRQMREKVELIRKKEELKLQKIREKEERVRKKAEEARLKKETQKWEKEIRDEEKRRERERKKEERKRERERKPPFEVIKVGSNSNVKFTTYFDSYNIKINKYPIDPVNVFQKASDMTINERGLVTGDKIRLIVSHPTWTKPFSTKLIKITNDKNFIYELIKAVLEFVEYKSVPLNELLVEVQSTKIPRGAGRLRIDKNNIVDKKSIICIKNTDSICQSQAIVTANALINKSKWTKSQLSDGFKKSRKLQEKEALKLHEEAGVEINEYGNTLEDVNTFAKHLGIQINIVDADYFNEIIYTSEGESIDGKIIYLYKNKNHYDVITSMPGFLGKDYYCHTCKKSYTHRDKHKCPKKCMSCFRYDSDCKGPEITCNNCNRTFPGQKCFDEHKRNRSKGDKPDIICNIIQKCLKCKRTVTDLKVHVCGFSECSNCKLYCNPKDHKCYMKVVETKGGHCTRPNTTTTVNEKRTNAKSEEEIQLMLAVRSIGWNTEEIEDMVDWTKEEIEEVLNCTDEEIKNMKNPSKFDIGCGNLNLKDRCLCCKTYTHNYVFYDLETQQDTGTHIVNYVNVQDFDGNEWTFNTIDEFCNFVFQDKHKNYTFIAHNSKSFDAQFILKYCIENGIKPFCIYNGTKIISLISEPTRVTNTSATLIDLIFTNDSNNIAKSGVIYNGMSDHSIIYVIRTFIPNKRGQIKKEVRNLKHFGEENFIHDLRNTNWQTVENVTDPNLAWKVWEMNFNKVLDRHAPLRHQRIRQSSIPWLNSNIKKMMRDRDYHKKQFVKHNSEYHWRIYQIFRNKVNIEIRKSKSRYYCQKLANAIKTI